MKIVAAKANWAVVWASAEDCDSGGVKCADENEKMLVLEVLKPCWFKVLLSGGLVGYIYNEHVYEVSS